MSRPTLTDTEIIDMVIAHANAQRLQSKDKAGTCLYRFDRTPTCPIRCFAGIFIDDLKYHNIYEARPFDALDDDILFYKFTKNQLCMIEQLQLVHDHDLGEWAEGIRDIIELYSITGLKNMDQLEELGQWILTEKDAGRWPRKFYV